MRRSGSVPHGDRTPAGRAGGLGTVLPPAPSHDGLLSAAARADLAAAGSGLRRHACAELARRVRTDRPSADLLADAATPPAIARVRIGLSDPHARGRSVCALEFAGGGAVMYKPRNLRTDAAFATFLDWLSAAAPALPPLRAARTLDRGSYGWAEYVAAVPCADAGAARRYYERAGALLAVAYVLRAGDLHSENVVAAGEHPVLIDLEAALSPVLGSARPRGDADATSVLDTCLLPLVTLNADGRGYAEGGIAPVAGAWGASEVDAVSAAVRRGFDLAYRALLANRPALLARGGPLRAFAGARTRVVLRATAVYAALLRRLASPRLAGDAAARAAEIDRLHRPFRGRPGWERMAPAFAAEAAALGRGDVPRFEIAAGGTALRADGRVVVPDFAALSGLAAVRRRVHVLGHVDRRRQLAYVRLAFAAEAHRHAATPHDMRGAAGDGDLTPDLAVAEARDIAALLARLAERGPGGVRWSVRDGASGAPALAPADASLGHGTAGLALTLAAVARVRAAAPSATEAGGHHASATEWAALARAAFAGVGCAAARGRSLGRLGALGLAAGAGGVAYAACAAARWLADDGPLEVAHAALDAVDPARLARPRDHDVFGGVAGLLLGLLAFHEATGDPEALARAVTCGDLLLASDVPAADRHPARRHGIAADPEGLGFGAPGRAVALLRLATHAGTPRHATAAESLLDASLGQLEERLTGSGAEDVGAGSERLGGWCHGDVGVGMALAAALGTTAGSADTRSRWAEALARVAAVVGAAPAPTRGEHYTLCCGTFARVELLAAAAAALGDAAHAAAARRLAGATVARARRRLAYHPVPHADPFAPGLFTGLAGVAYTLLRAVDPSGVPSVLAGVLPSAAWAAPAPTVESNPSSTG